MYLLRIDQFANDVFIKWWYSKQGITSARTFCQLMQKNTWQQFASFVLFHFLSFVINWPLNSKQLHIKTSHIKDELS